MYIKRHFVYFKRHIDYSQQDVLQIQRNCNDVIHLDIPFRYLFPDSYPGWGLTFSDSSYFWAWLCWLHLRMVSIRSYLIMNLSNCCIKNKQQILYYKRWRHKNNVNVEFYRRDKIECLKMQSKCHHKTLFLPSL